MLSAVQASGGGVKTLSWAGLHQGGVGPEGLRLGFGFSANL